MLSAFFEENHIDHKFTHPYTPEENGHVESFHSILSKALKHELFADLQALERRLQQFYASYNDDRCHGSTAGLPPAKFWALHDLGKIETVKLKNNRLRFKPKVAYQDVLTLPDINRYHEVLEKVSKTAPEQVNNVQNWEAWCMTLTRNRSLDKTRSQTIRRTAPLEGVAERSSDVFNPAAETESSDLVQKVKFFMQDLPDKQRMVMHLRDIEELTYEEIAEALNITMEQVKVNLHRARKTIREKMVELVK
jgi:RNA polymerase sigma-70 factor (ECF subfamily)